MMAKLQAGKKNIYVGSTYVVPANLEKLKWGLNCKRMETQNRHVGEWVSIQVLAASLYSKVSMAEIELTKY